MSGLVENNKLTLNECRRILSKNGLTHTEDEIILIRNWFYQLAEIAADNHEIKENSPLIEKKLTAAKNKGNP